MAEKGFKERIKQMFNWLFNEENSKLVRRLVILIFAGVLFLTLGNLAGSDDDTQQFSPTSNSEIKTNRKELQKSDPESTMEKKLTRILSNITGVGEVAVNVTLKTGPEYKYAKNDDLSTQETKEEANDGGTRSIKKREEQREVVIIRKNDGSEEAVIKKKTKPKIKGVMVVAQGADSSYVKADLISAIKTGLGVPAHKIVVLPMKR